MGSISANQRVPKKGKEFRCRACKNILPLEEKSETVSSGTHHYCKACAVKKLKEDEKAKTNNINEVPFGQEKFKNNSEIYIGDEHIVNYENVREVVDYILDLFKLDAKAHYAYLTMQINHLINNYRCNYKGIYLTLKYYYLLLDNPIPEEPHIISIVASNYSKALQAYKLERDLSKKADELIEEKIPVVNVYVSRTARRKYNEHFDNKWRCYENMIGLDKIELDEDDYGV